MDSLNNPIGAAASRARLVALAPAPKKTCCTTTNVSEASSATSTFVPYACQPCVRKKVKCDKILPTCSTCAKTKLECVYRAPPPPRPRRRKRSVDVEEAEKLDEDIYGRLARYERMLQDHGLLPESQPDSPSDADLTEISKKAPLAQLGDRNKANTGKLLSADGKSWYITSRVWLDADEIDMRELSEHDHHDPSDGPGIAPDFSSFPCDPISGSIFGIARTLINRQPTPQDISKLWTAYLSNIEPIVKLLHIPTTSKMIEAVLQQPSNASKAQECLLFSIYHAAIISMTNEECLLEFAQSRSALLDTYRQFLWTALSAVSWLKTIDILVLQAYVLFLIVMRTTIDPHTYWILTSIGVRIAQRMGLHRDGESLGLAPFDVELRRRLFWQLLPLDAFIGQISGSGISIVPSSWDTKMPLNINDDQIFPGMDHQPKAQQGVSEMIFCLARAELTNLFTRTGVNIKECGLSIELKEAAELDAAITEIESIIESKYLRYCDIGNPLQLLTLGVVRSALNTIRLRNCLSMFKNKGIGDEDLRRLCVLSHRILDTDNAIYNNTNTKKYHWCIRSCFMWDALKCILTSLAKPDLLSDTERDSTWNKMTDFYSNRPEILEANGAIQASICKATLQTWNTNPQESLGAEPFFIAIIRSQNSKAQSLDQTARVNHNLSCNADGDEAIMNLLDAEFNMMNGNSLDSDDMFLYEKWIG